MTRQTARPRAVTIEETMALLDRSRATVYRYIKSGDLKVLPRRWSDRGKTMLDYRSVDALRSRWFAPGDEAAS